VVGLGHPLTWAKRAGSAKLVAAPSAQVLVFCRTAVLIRSPSADSAWNFRCLGLSSVTPASACGPRSACMVVATWPKFSRTRRGARGATVSHELVSIGVGAICVPVLLEPGVPEPDWLSPSPGSSIVPLQPAPRHARTRLLQIVAVHDRSLMFISEPQSD